MSAADHASRPAPAAHGRVGPGTSRRTMLLLSAVAASALASCSHLSRGRAALGGTELTSDQTRAGLSLSQAPDLKAAVGA